MVSRCFPGGYNVKLYISRGRLAWWLLAFLCCASSHEAEYSIILLLLPIYEQPLSSRFIGSGTYVCFVEMNAEQREKFLIGKDRKVDGGVRAKVAMLKEKRKRYM